MFDSGVGGLNVLRVLEQALPGRQYIYLGDAARLPYGTKSPETVERYAIKAARLLLDRGVSALVVACNTASAVALPALSLEAAPVPVIGVIEPGSDAACKMSTNGCIAVLATEGTVRGGAYQRAVLARRPDARIIARSASLLVTLAEDLQGQNESLCEMIVRESVRGLFGSFGADTLLLGCTHFPALEAYFARILPAHVRMVDSATEVARKVAEVLPETGGGEGGRVLLSTDNSKRFARLGSLFLGKPILPSEVELVELL